MMLPGKYILMAGALLGGLLWIGRSRRSFAPGIEAKVGDLVIIPPEGSPSDKAPSEGILALVRSVTTDTVTTFATKYQKADGTIVSLEKELPMPPLPKIAVWVVK